MPYIPYTPVDIVLEIPDIVLASTIIKRKAKMLTMIYNQAYLTLTVAWQVQHYADDSGQYGQYIGAQVADKLKETIADNEVIVDAQTGDILTDTSVCCDDVTNCLNCMGQYDWFNMIGETTPVIVHELIRKYGEQADWFTNLK
jgi:hypothetical protein